jgi:Protein of unknown function (DUF4231)
VDDDASAPPGRARLGIGWPPWGERKWLRESWDQLEKFAGELDLDGRESDVLDLRWVREARHYDDLWRRQRKWHDVFGVVTIVAGLAAPLLVAVNAADWALAVAGFVVAASGSLAGFFRYGERWRHQRETAMLLKSEGITFLELRSPYDVHSSHRNAFPDFIENLERINEARSEEYLALLRQRSLRGAEIGEPADDSRN